ncbi:DUF2842 domain-containing protein [Aliiroseovarius sp.]|uniref:DUF2842 domain-containing protein n=1 Tax=Aliiroseovarius sp. TaxID=1872442 RepID=UPI002604B828|nr:DUF2842 domain-containing protein [Aliiroseovarius sp.]
MALSYKTRKRLSILILVVGLPLYIIAAVSLVNWLDRPHILVELAVYVVLGFLWMIPFRKVFLGVGKGDPDKDPDSYPHDPAGKYGPQGGKDKD